ELDNLIVFDKSFFLVVALLLLALLLERRRPMASPPGPPARRLLLALALVPLLAVLLVAKHPASHHLVPAIGLSGVALALAWRAMEPSLTTRVSRALLLAALLAGLALFRLAPAAWPGPRGDLTATVRALRDPGSDPR